MTIFIYLRDVLRNCVLEMKNIDVIKIKGDMVIPGSKFNFLLTCDFFLFYFIERQLNDPCLCYFQGWGFTSPTGKIKRTINFYLFISDSLASKYRVMEGITLPHDLG
jgi:hypothetical protein